MKLPFTSKADWRFRWLVFPSWRVLHRIAFVYDMPGLIENCTGYGRTVCKGTGNLTMPGISSRLGLRRCAHCCRMLKIPRGFGAPANYKIEEPTTVEAA